MKKLFLIFIMFISFSVMGNVEKTENLQSNSTSKEYVTDSNVEKLIDKYGEKLESALFALSESLKQPVEHVYNILIRQQYVKAFSGIVLFIISIILIVLCIVFAKNVDDWDVLIIPDGKSKASPAFAVIFGVCGLITSIIFFAGGYFSDILQGLINPEYGAIMDILKLF